MLSVAVRRGPVRTAVKGRLVARPARTTFMGLAVRACQAVVGVVEPHPPADLAPARGRTGRAIRVARRTDTSSTHGQSWSLQRDPSWPSSTLSVRSAKDEALRKRNQARMVSVRAQ